MLTDPHYKLIIKFDESVLNKRHNIKWERYLGGFLMSLLSIRHMQGFDTVITFRLEHNNKVVSYDLATDPGEGITPRNAHPQPPSPGDVV